MNSSLVITPTRLARFGYAIFECLTGVGMILLAQPWMKPVGTQRFFLVGIGVVLVVAGLEFPWRRVIVMEAAIRERLWFHWRTHELPYRVTVGRDSHGRVVVAEPPIGRIVFRFIREFGRPADIEKRLTEFFEGTGRLELVF